MSRLLAALVFFAILLSFHCPATVPALNKSVFDNALGLEDEPVDNLPTVAAIAATAGSSGASNGARINIQVSGTTYASGSTFDFTGTSSAPVAFTIQNLGGSTLSITGSSVTNAGNYTMVAPGSNSIIPGGTTTFTVANSSGGGGTAIIQIMSNSAVSPTYIINALPCFC